MNRFFQKLKGAFGGHDAHAKNTVRYFLIVITFLLFLFFSNDFDLINVQKTAIVVAIGIDRTDDEFTVTSQIAIPGARGQSGNEQAMDVVTSGKTVAQALEAVNEKTGWYPKLVFCRLLLLGESTTNRNVFDALEYFLRDEYIADDCLVAACDGSAQELLSTQTPIDASGAEAIEKVLSNHAKRVGTSLPNTLRLFSASYFGADQSGFLPLVKAESLSDEQAQSKGAQQNSQGKQDETQNGGQSGKSQEQSGEGGKSGQSAQEQVFSAGETALFSKGVRIGTLSKEESFVYAVIKNNLRLASYSLPYDEQTYTLTVKKSNPSVKLSMDKEKKLTVSVRLAAGIADASKAKPVEQTVDVGDLPAGLLPAAAEKLTGEIRALFEKCRALNFDAFDAIDKLQKYEREHFEAHKDTLLQDLSLDVQVEFKSVR